MAARLYDKRAWRRRRAAFLGRNPYCAMCQAVGKTTLATVVDHVQAHQGDVVKFWDESNWQSLCKVDHDAAKAELERTGRVRGCDADGRPFDPNHLWNRPTE